MTHRDSTVSQATAADVDRHHQAYSEAMASVRHAIAQFDGCSEAEKAALAKELADLEAISQKLEMGRVEIVLFGEIDTGKSALINALMGQSVAQVDVRGGWTKEVWSTSWSGCGYVVPGLEQSQVVLLDTPGINEVDGQQRAIMAHDAAARADLILFLTDSDLNQTEYNSLLQLSATHKPIILVLNKIDRIAKTRLLPIIDWYRRQREFAAIVPVSALTGDGVEILEREIIGQLPEGEPRYPDDFLTDQPERVLAAETVREKVLQHTHAELPFTTAVIVDMFDDETQPGLLRLYCSILVERASQKPIVIGHGGALVRQIGTEARQDLERFFGTRVYLDLQVKVRPEWRENDRILDQAGVAPKTRA